MEWIHPVSFLILRELRWGERSITDLTKSIAPLLGKNPYGTVQRCAWKLARHKVVNYERRGKKVLLSLRDSPLTKVALHLAEVIAFDEAMSKAAKPVADAARELVEQICRELSHVSLDAYFYGSFAKGTATKVSDVDVLLVAPKEAVKAVEETAGKVLGIHALVVDREMFQEMARDRGPHYQSVQAGIHLKLPI
ncbi:MAG: nucleotidyltransferase domain-containing protein [Hadesarchaea archaeon]|nr:nucleotidyltransferase domain-containing protein [Hadesarchaea archaeon]